MDAEVGMEIWDLLDGNREPLLRTHVRGVPMEEGTYHLIADIWVVTRNGQILLTQRDPEKKHGLKWECTGGSVLAGEESLKGALRELYEETGLSAKEEDCTLIDTVRLEERFVDTYLTCMDVCIDSLVLQVGEVVAAKLVTFDELCGIYEAGEAVPSRFHRYHETLKKNIRNVMRSV